MSFPALEKTAFLPMPSGQRKRLEVCHEGERVYEAKGGGSRQIDEVQLQMMDELGPALGLNREEVQEREQLSFVLEEWGVIKDIFRPMQIEKSRNGHEADLDFAGSCGHDVE